ncbi:serine/threonine-protein kinase PAK 2-like isoform X1 [Chaetoceros tenuissimus]|uniref:Serine/threonine-protein kinase PAK 2-like isoform X1 n=1 Tax=Chaetoceros tenuissimus TaxID=426638 RepID=A0AAD3H4N6_9STRA|nr:serine/threonine-protein kinase PAK 2-like isoform X1 [Chaetoceros tenuissimus]
MARSSRIRDSKFYNCNVNFDQSWRSVSFAASDDEYSFSDDDYESRRSNASSIYSVRKRPEKKLSLRQKRCRNIFITFMSFVVSIACGYFALMIVIKFENDESEPTNIPTGSPTMLASQETSHDPSLEPSLLPSLEPTLILSSTPSVDKPSKESKNDSVTSFPSHFSSTSPSFFPSSFPSMIPTVQFTEEPSHLPSETNSPSNPPSQSPSILVPSTSPSSMTSAEVNKEIQIISTFRTFGDDTTSDWCLSASTSTQGSKLYVKECLASDSNLQLWKFTSEGHMTLARMGDFCVKSTFAQLTLENCGDASDITIINFEFRNGSITQTKNSNVWRIGFDPENSSGRLQLYRNGILNDSLDKWNVVYPLLPT